MTQFMMMKNKTEYKDVCDGISKTANKALFTDMVLYWKQNLVKSRYYVSENEYNDIYEYCATTDAVKDYLAAFPYKENVQRYKGISNATYNNLCDAFLG